MLETFTANQSFFRSSLARTIMQEDVPEFLRLVQEGTRVWDFDDHGWSPLHWACSRGSIVMTYAILQEMRSSQEAGGHLPLILPHKGLLFDTILNCVVSDLDTLSYRKQRLADDIPHHTCYATTR